MNTIVALTTLEERKYLRALVYGDLGSGRSAFAHSFPDPILVDATGTLYRRDDAPDVPMLRSSDPRSILGVVQLIESGAVAPQTLVIDGLSAVQEFLEANTSLKGFDAYGEVRNQLTRLMDALFALPLHLVFVTRSKNEHARPGDVVGGQMIAIGEQLVCGTAPEVHRVLNERFDLVLEMMKNQANRTVARVHASTLQNAHVDDVFAAPDGISILKRLSLAVTPNRVPDGPPDPETYARWLRAKAAAKEHGLAEEAYKELLAECRRTAPATPSRHLTLAQTDVFTSLLTAWATSSVEERIEIDRASSEAPSAVAA